MMATYLRRAKIAPDLVICSRSHDSLCRGDRGRPRYAGVARKWRIRSCYHQIAASIREWSWTVPVLIDDEGGIIAGHGRVLAAHKLAIAEVPVMVAAGWSEAQKRAYVLADNKLALNAGWDEELLKIEIGDLQAFDFDLGLIGFSADEIAGLTFDKSGLTDLDETPETPAIPESATGDVWLLGKHRLVCGDCADRQVVDKAFAGVKPHLMVTDPPYGVGFERGKFVGREKAAKGLKFAPIANDDLRGAALAEFIGSALDAWAVEAGITSENFLSLTS